MNTNSIITFTLVFLPLLGAFVTYFCGKKNIKVLSSLAQIFTALVFFVSAAGLVLFINDPGQVEGVSVIGEICGRGIAFSLNGFRVVYAFIAAFMWMMTTLMSEQYFGHHHNQARYYFFILLTECATLGVFLGNDLYTIFIFFEIMSFTSYVWVAQEETKGALRAAETYLAVAVIGGLSMLMGIFMIYHELGTLDVDALRESAMAANTSPAVLFVASILMAIGFGAKAGAFPLHIWLPKAHPVAPAPASALLSGILTKSGIFGVIVVTCNIMSGDKTWGILILVIGLITMFMGAVLALFSVNIKRVLACSSMSQIGFILTGIGAYNAMHAEHFLASSGSMLHMINHSLIKLVLFMAAGVIFFNTQALDINDVRGFGRKKPVFALIFLTGALSIAGIPGFSGYVSKTLLHESILEVEMGSFTRIAEAVFLISGGITLCYMTKLFVAIFVEKNADEVLQAKYDDLKNYMNPKTAFALTGSALLLFVWGIFPHRLMEKVAGFGADFYRLSGESEAIPYFAWNNLKGGLISVSIGIILYFAIVRCLLMKNGRYLDRWPKWWDLENAVYRPLLLTILPTIAAVFSRVFDSLVDGIVLGLRNTLYKDSPLPGKKKEMSMRSLRVKEDVDIIRRSISYGFFLFAVGVIITVVYIFVFHFGG
ncbi:MAG: sodium:proton antiporter [Acetatifactor sp.]|nr:sodium:proton antiporter [Acetatifactor sp.]